MYCDSTIPGNKLYWNKTIKIYEHYKINLSFLIDRRNLRNLRNPGNEDI